MFQSGGRALFYYIGISVLCLSSLKVQASADLRESLLVRFDSCRMYLQDDLPLSAESLQWAYEEMEVANLLADSRSLVRAYIDLGEVYRRMERYDLALQHAFRALLILDEEEGMIDLEADANCLLGVLYSLLDSPRQSMDYLEKSNAYYRQSGDTMSMLKVMGEMAVVKGREKDYDACIAMVEEVYFMSKRMGIERYQLVSMLNIAQAFYITCQPERGLNMLERIALEVSDTALLSQYQAVFLLYRGEFLMQMGRDDEAEKDFKLGLAKVDTLSNRRFRGWLLENMMQIARRRSEAQELCYYFDEWRRNEDSIHTAANQRRMDETEFVYGMERYESDLEKARERLFVSRIMICIVVLVAIFVFWVLYSGWRKQIREKRRDAETLGKELALEKEMLVTMVVYSHETRNLMSKVIEILKQTNVNVATEPERKSIRNAYGLLQGGVSNCADSLGKFIDSQYGVFLQKLAARCPDLTLNEKRVCAMLLIGMSSKEIAGVLDFSTGTLDNIRSRIRKKLGIPEEKSMQDYMKSI